MARRLLTLALALVGCNAHLGGDGDKSDGGPIDGRLFRDGPTPDARACAGGDKAMIGPDGSCFVMINAPKTYLQGKAACEAMVAHLAYLKDATQDGFAELFVGTLDTWIGGSDRVTEGMFLWEDGTAFSFTNWGTGEPNNGGTGATYQEDCVIIAGARTTKKWDDRPCDASQVATSGMFATLCNY